MAKRQPSRASLPPQLLDGVYWAFTGEPFADRTAFDAAVRQYQIDIGGEDTWRPEEVVLPCPRVAVGYMYWEGDEQLGATVELATKDGRPFTAGELLFQLHNAVVAHLREIDHKFLEGLSLAEQPAPREVPLYYMLQGS